MTAQEELIDALRRKARASSEASWMLANAKTARNRAAEGEPNDGPGYQGLDPEQTIEWKAAEAIIRLSQHAEEIREAAAKIAEEIWDHNMAGAHGGEQANRTARAIRRMPER